MRIVVGTREAEHQRVCVEDSLEVRDDRDGADLAQQGRFAAERGIERALSGARSASGTVGKARTR